MAFDDATRGRLQTFVTKARAILTDEFTQQFQQDYGLDPGAGTVSPLESLAHLDDQRLATARVLREIFDHYLPSALSDGQQARKTTLDRMVREQAFTTLNRLAALRMMEARGLVMECVGKAYQSKAFQLYLRVAGTALGETGDAYRVFLLSMCDIYGADLPVLFDRFFPNGRLFPREPALLPLFDLINAADIAPLWAEDETIGWIYQYFNSRDERKAMRDASQAPRNSRELAVRNQFFTPRYVVEFLVDNTLGRLWFNWTGGASGLRDRCQYLLVKPDETPDPPRRLRDPRTIKLLDPACGSMHFGLYAFDLFLDIYREAWSWEERLGPGSLDAETGGGPDLKPLCQTYADEDAFLRDVPRLIIEHNIYGVDIDPRAAQIASLALWLRAQRAWHEAGVKAQDRPAIGRGHVVAAVAPPAEYELRRKFVETLDPLSADLFEKTLVLLKGLPELGVLLQVEKDIPCLVKQVFGDHGGMFRQQDEVQWHKAEVQLQEALTDFAHAARSSYQGRLFVEDALQGLRIIDTCRENFDVVVMNPPFGAPTENTYSIIRDKYFGSHNDIYAAFVARACELAPQGYVGCISSRSFLLSPRLQTFRENVILPRVSVLADLGWGVMDDALVEAAAYALSNGNNDKFLAVDVRRDPNGRELALKSQAAASTLSVCQTEWFSAIPQSKLLYSAPPEVRELLATRSQFEPDGGTAREGMKSFDNFRFIRLNWEIDATRIGVKKKWISFNKGGEFSYFYSDFHLLLNWASDGAELRDINISLNGSTAQVRQASDYWYLPGVTYSKRSSRGFSARALPAGMIFTSNGPAVLPSDEVSSAYLLGWINSKQIRALIHLQSNASDYSTGSLKRLPWKEPSAEHKTIIERIAINAILAVVKFRAQINETSPFFVAPLFCKSFSEASTLLRSVKENVDESIQRSLSAIDSVIDSVYQISNSGWAEELLGLSDEPDENSEDKDENEDADNVDLSEQAVLAMSISFAIGVAFSRFDWRVVTGERTVPSEFDPFAPLPLKSPGMLPDGDAPFHTHSGILVDDAGHKHDLARLIEEVLARVDAPVPSDVRRWLQRDFFAFHLQNYSKSRRKAPIYWPLSTASGAYTLWVYYPNLTNQTLYTAVNDFLEGSSGKLKQVEQEVAALRAKSARSRDEDKKLESAENLEAELIDLRDTLLRIASTYHPNHDDGVQITAAPLWPLCRHKPWQKILKDTWVKLEKGDYDWAHLALSYWPDRVREKCKTDKSLAIAHDLEHLYVEPEQKAAKPRGRKKGGEA